MNVHIIAYDLKGHEAKDDYRRLSLAIFMLGKVQWLQYSTWIVESNLSDVQIRNRLVSAIDYNDSLFVATINSYASYNIPDQASSLVSQAWNPNPLLLALEQVRKQYA